MTASLEFARTGRHSRQWLAPVRYRLAQARAHLTTPDRPITLLPRLANLLNDCVQDAFRDLPAADQVHLAGIATHLANTGWDDDVVTAGLLHDIGKAAPGIRISVLDRGAWVILRQVWPSGADRLAFRDSRPRVGAGVWALSRHAGTGAAMLAAAGYNSRVCWLVQHHERSDSDDPGLGALIAADNAREPLVAATAP